MTKEVAQYQAITSVHKVYTLTLVASADVELPEEIRSSQAIRVCVILLQDAEEAQKTETAVHPLPKYINTGTLWQDYLIKVGMYYYLINVLANIRNSIYALSKFT